MNHNKINESGYNEAPKFGPSDNNPSMYMFDKKYDLKGEEFIKPISSTYSIKNKIMCSEITQDELEKLSYKTLDELYESYEIKHSFTTCLYLRFNGDAEDPGELLTKEEFTKLCIDSTEWATAYESLFNYIVKEYKLKQK